MTKLLLITAAGGLGSLLRYLIAGWGQRLAGPAFPLGTLIVNALGCLLIGLFAAALSGRILIREEHRIALTVGLLGGFTTFSSFSLETLGLVNDGQVFRAVLNVVLNVGLGLTAVWLGYRSAEICLGV
ncbi:MAG: fluoride efflux transporter CrcB [Phycisphaerae bacterium]